MKKLIEYTPLVIRILQAVFEGVRKNESDEEIRARVADPSVILADDLAKLRAAKDDIDDFIAGG